MRTDIKYTYQDYAALPEGAAYQLVEGELVMSPAPDLRHQKIVRELMTPLWGWIKERRLGEAFVAPTDVILSEEDTVQPDILFVSNARKHMLADEGIRGGPDLCVEVLSSRNRALDCVVKRKLYARHQVIEYWIVDPDARTVELYRLQEDAKRPAATFREDDTLRSAMFPGFQLRLTDLFAP